MVEGATGRTFRLGGAEVGGRVEARVTATNSVGSATSPTAPSAVVVRYRHPPVRNLHHVPFFLRRLLR